MTKLCSSLRLLHVLRPDVGRYKVRPLCVQTNRELSTPFATRAYNKKIIIEQLNSQSN